jgi:hypothetical protein
VVEHGGGGGSGSRVRVWGLLGDRPLPDIEDVEKGGSGWWCSGGATIAGGRRARLKGRSYGREEA